METEVRIDRIEYELRQVRSRVQRLELDAEPAELPELPPLRRQAGLTSMGSLTPAGFEMFRESPASSQTGHRGKHGRSSLTLLGRIVFQDDFLERRAFDAPTRRSSALDSMR